jgi:hypothetical protein
MTVFASLFHQDICITGVLPDGIFWFAVHAAGTHIITVKKR